MATGRLFDGIDDRITLAVGNCGGAFGPATVCAVIKRNNTIDNGIFGGYDGALTTDVTWILGLDDNAAGNDLYLDIPDVGFVTAPTITVTNADNQVLIAISKASGTVAPRFHRYKYDTTTWTHENGASTLANGPATSNRLHVGELAGDFFAGDVLIIAFWKRVLSDAEIEGLQDSVEGWVNLNPDGLWRFNQPNVADDVLDVTGGGANETAITGTTVGINDFPGFLIQEEGGYYLREAGVDRYLREDGSGFYLREGVVPPPVIVELDARIQAGALARAGAAMTRPITTRAQAQALARAQEAVARRFSVRTTGQANNTSELIFAPTELLGSVAGSALVRGQMAVAHRYSARVSASSLARAQSRVSHLFSARSAGGSNVGGRIPIEHRFSARVSARSDTRASSRVSLLFSSRVLAQASTKAQSAVARIVRARAQGLAMMINSFEEVGATMQAFVSASSRAIGALRMSSALKSRTQGSTLTVARAGILRRVMTQVTGQAAARAVERVTRAITSRSQGQASALSLSRISRGIRAAVRAGASVLGALPPQFVEYIPLFRRYLRGSMRAGKMEASMSQEPLEASMKQEPITWSAKDGA